MMAETLVLLLIATSAISMIEHFSALYTKSGPLTKQLHLLPIWLSAVGGAMGMARIAVGVAGG